jgi:hypothetical protein
MLLRIGITITITITIVTTAIGSNTTTLAQYLTAALPNRNKQQIQTRYGLETTTGTKIETKIYRKANREKAV